MKTSRRFLITLSLAALTAPQALPCIDYEDTSMCDHFICQAPLPSYLDSGVDESAQFWARYLGEPCTDELREAVRYMSAWAFEDDATNYLVQQLRARGDQEALGFLQLNAKLLDLQQTASSWDYESVTPADYQALLARIDALKVTGELARRKTFMKIRCLFSLKDYDACLRLWDQFASRWEPSPLRRRVEGYIAGVHYRRQEYDRAVPFFVEVGDDRSIQMCVNRMLSTTSIAAEYERDPNSAILPYIIQDYANYYFHASAENYWEPDAETYWEHGADNPIWTVVTEDAQRNIALAKRVVAEGKARDLRMWQAYAGFLEMFGGQADAAYQSFSRAETLPGNELLAHCLPYYKLNASLRMKQKPAHYDAYLLREVRGCYDLLVGDSLQQPTDEADGGVAPSFVRNVVLPSLYAYIGQHADSLRTFVMQSAFEPYGMYDRLNATFDADGLLALRAYLHSQPGSEIEAFALRHTALAQSSAELDDCIGTRMMREGRFAEAIGYFEQLPQSYLCESYYPRLLCAMKPSHKPFFREVFGAPEYDESLPIVNRKLEYCHEVLRLQQAVEGTTGQQRAEAQYALANWYFQGSSGGDLWPISEYGHSPEAAHHNEFSDMAIACLQDAIAHTRSYNTMTECYFGLAAIDTGWAPARHYDYDRQCYYIDTEGTQLEAYQWLRKQRNRQHPLFRTCDWLRLYVVGME